ncbi:unnamed protein product [Arabidopsis lyrata]|nr:unnamed protein product [Arabidopsis lyrata]
MALMKLLVSIAITTAITIAVITTRTNTTTTTIREYTSFDALSAPTIRPNRFLAQKEVGERNPNAADHCTRTLRYVPYMEGEEATRR